MMLRRTSPWRMNKKSTPRLTAGINRPERFLHQHEYREREQLATLKWLIGIMLSELDG
jgi:hypothetical protein